MPSSVDALRCVIVLSTKSSGSSALQQLLCTFGGGRHVRHTRHGEYETLFWTKAASALGLPQTSVPDSEVPIPRLRAVEDLRALILANARLNLLPSDERALVTQGWRSLTAAHQPLFVEKSPHHLHQWSCLQLMFDVFNELTDIDFRFVGLVRNPMDVMYSAWTRWRLPPEEFQHHWRQAYENLTRFHQLVGDRLVIARYEDFASSRQTASDLFSKLGIAAVRPGADEYIHGGARSRWKEDDTYGFQLDPAVRQTAASYGYRDGDLANIERRSWPIRRAVMTMADRCVSRPVRRAKRQLRMLLRPRTR